MNRTRIALGMAILAGVILPGTMGRLQAQQSPSSIRVAVVNVGQVLNKYEKAKAFKGKIEKVLDPFKQKGEVLKKQIVDWAEAMKSKEFDPAKRDQYENGIVNNRRQLEDLEREARKLIGKEQEEQIVTLFKEVAGAVQAYAKANGIHLVVGYGEQFEGDVFSFVNINRKMQGMDIGGTNPLFVAPGVDISDAVAQTLNNYWRQAQQSSGGTVTPVSNTKN